MAHIIDDIYEKTVLFDIYGDLLTDKQKELYNLYYLEDYSLAEIAEEKGISRQGVRDSVKKSYEHLLDYENKLSIMKRYLRQRENLTKVISFLEAGDEASLDEAKLLAKKMKEVL